MSPIALNNPIKKINNPATKPMNHTNCKLLGTASAIKPNCTTPPLNNANNEKSAISNGTRPRIKNNAETFKACNILTKYVAS